MHLLDHYANFKKIRPSWKNLFCPEYGGKKEVMKWCPPGRRKRGRLKLTWAEGIKGLMGEKGLMEEDWNDRSNWRKKII